MTALLRLCYNKRIFVAGINRQTHLKLAAFVPFTFDEQTTPMTIDDMLDDGQTQPSSTHRARASLVYPIKSLSQTRQMLRINALAIIAHANFHTKPAFRQAIFKDINVHIDTLTIAAILNGACGYKYYKKQ